ncbi:MAG: hypothetical protein WBG57_10020, partial [Ornithinimicrobium sp.]
VRASDHLWTMTNEEADVSVTDQGLEGRVRHRARAAEPERWLIVAGRGRIIAEHSDAIQDLLFAKHTVRVAFGVGRIPRQKLKLARPHQLLRPPRSLRATGWAAAAAQYLFRPRDARLLPAARTSRSLAREIADADRILLLDTEAAGLRTWILQQRPGARVWSTNAAQRLIRHEAAMRWLDHEARWAEATPIEAKTNLARMRRLLADLDDPDGHCVSPLSDSRPQLRRYGRRRLRQGGYKDVRTCVEAGGLLEQHFGPSEEDDLLAALGIHVDLVEGGAVPAGFTEILGRLFAHADRSMTRGEASEVAAIPIGLLFHQQLHTAVAQSPLTSSPSTFLAPFLDSRVGQALVAPVGKSSSDRGETRPDKTRRRVIVMPGVYEHHATPMIAALTQDERADLTVVRQSGRAFAGMMIDQPILHERLISAGLSDESRADLGEFVIEANLAMTDADVVVADWADKGAVWTSIAIPPGVRLVVRIHSVDVLSAPIHLIDWHRVDDVIFVSEHIRDLFKDVIGARAETVRQHVITNIVSPHKFSKPLLPEANRTLGMVGWGQLVKDPMMALDILASLLEHDDTWRLRLIGADFVPSQVVADREYVKAFHDKVLSPQFLDRVDFPGFTRELDQQLRHVGFILSTSLRESCPVGVLEGVAAGAVPIVREWPVFAQYNGARRLFPDQHVFNTVDEAVELILALTDEDDQRKASAAVRDALRENYAEDGNERRLLDVILQ